MATTNTATTVAFLLALVGGLIVLISSIVNAVWFSYGASSFGGYGSYMRGVMDGYHNFMGSNADSTGFLASLSIVGVVCGVIVVMSAIMLKVNPRQHVVWAVIIIAFSALSFVGMGGFFIGAIIGIIAGVFDLSLRQNT